MYGWDSIETEYNLRLNSYSSYVTDFIIHSIQDEKKEQKLNIPYFLL